MKKTLAIIMLLLAFTINIDAQTENKRDSVGTNIEQALDRFNDLNKPKYDVETAKRINNLSPEEVVRRKEFVRTMHFTTPEFYVGPATENKPYGRILPTINDYTFGDYHQLTDDISLSTTSSQNTYVTIGAIRRVDASLNYQATDWLSISGGVYGAKYNYYGNHYNDLGFNAELRLKMHDRIFLKGYGAYSVNAQRHGEGLPQAGKMLFPSTYFGGGVEFKVTQKFGVEGGMLRELNPFNGKWQNTPYVMPTFYLFGR